jgi:hypothetical protein
MQTLGAKVQDFLAPVNPDLDTFYGDRCYPDVPSIPGGVDGPTLPSGSFASVARPASGASGCTSLSASHRPACHRQRLSIARSTA